MKIVLTGDIHSNRANELRVDDLKPEGRSIAAEFVATSLSSGGNGEAERSHHDLYLANNPCVKSCNAELGYILCDLTPERWIGHYKVVDDVLKPGGKTTVRASFRVNSGDATVHSA